MARRSGYTKRDIKNINVIIGLNLRAARKNAGMTQTDVMQAVYGVSNNRNRISEIENGKKELSAVDLLVFQDLYGQSLDYICGLSIEPEMDVMAGTVNHVVNQSQSIIEMLTTELATVVVSHVKSINKDDSAALLEATKGLCMVVKSEYEAGNISRPVAESAVVAMRVVRTIEVKQARQVQAVDTQMMQIAERIDQQDRHYLQKDRDKHYQYSIPIPSPRIMDDSQVVGVGYE